MIGELCVWENERGGIKSERRDGRRGRAERRSQTERVASPFRTRCAANLGAAQRGFVRPSASYIPEPNISPPFILYCNQAIAVLFFRIGLPNVVPPSAAPHDVDLSDQVHT